jgi:hypothetical protein
MIPRKYRTSSTSLRLFPEESITILRQLGIHENIEAQLNSFDVNKIIVNSESTQKRIFSEVKLRFLKIERVLQSIELEKLTDDDMKILLFYAICKSQPLIVEFGLTVLQGKMKNLDFELSTYEIEQFIYQKAEEHSELNDLSPAYVKEMASRISRLFVQIGMLENGELNVVNVSPNLVGPILEEGDAWFFDVLLIKDLSQI